MFFRNKKFKITENTAFITIFIFATVLLISIVYAATSYRVNSGATVKIDEWSVCKKVTNNNSKDIFVPTNTDTEWTDFRNNATGVSLAGCDPCESHVNTNWGAGPAGCTGSDQRCWLGRCITCGGWMNAGYCWYKGEHDRSCTDVCYNHGAVYNGQCDWVNDPADCSTAKHWYACDVCGSAAEGPGYYVERDLYHHDIKICDYHTGGYNYCHYSRDDYERICACNE